MKLLYKYFPKGSIINIFPKGIYIILKGLLLFPPPKGSPQTGLKIWIIVVVNILVLKV